MSAATAKARIELRPFDLSDLPVVYRWIKNQRNLFCDDGPQNERDFVDDQLSRESTNFAVYRDRELVGLLICDRESSVVCQAHCYFKRSFWGWENTAAALRLGMDWAFNEAGYDQITSPVFENNRLMIRLLEHLGAVREPVYAGCVRQNGYPVLVLNYTLYRGD